MYLYQFQIVTLDWLIKRVQMSQNIIIAWSSITYHVFYD